MVPQGRRCIRIPARGLSLWMDATTGDLDRRYRLGYFGMKPGALVHNVSTGSQLVARALPDRAWILDASTVAFDTSALVQCASIKDTMMMTINRRDTASVNVQTCRESRLLWCCGLSCKSLIFMIATL